MRILAVDTSCDESCCAIFDTESFTLLSDVVQSHIPHMTKYGGIVPEVASRQHLMALPLVVEHALSSANLKLQQVDWFAVTHRPGLIGALLVGVNYVKALAYAQQKPFSVIDHLEAHLFSPLLSSMGTSPRLAFPWIALVVSGGHTEMYTVEGVDNFRRLGSTLDDAAGEAFDKIGKLMGLPYPAGPQMDRLLKESRSKVDPKAFRFPIAETPRYHFSYSGLKTAVALEVKRLGERAEKLSLLWCAQEAILQPLVNAIKEARKEFPLASVVVTGGVACNSRLREYLPDAHFPQPKHCSDNAAMVALLAALRHESKTLLPSPWTETAYP